MFNRCQRASIQVIAVALTFAAIVLTAFPRDAGAIPAFARKYEASCQTCHTVYPVLNPFGEAFRRNGYRFPSQGGSVDSDAAKAPTIALGQEEYINTFPHSVWPDKILEAVPLSVMLNGSVAMNFPNSDAASAARGNGNVFTFAANPGELHIFGGGAFSDTLTYFSQLTINTQGQVDIETAYLLWNDIVGPRHAVNLWMGRLMGPQLNSFGLHSSFLADTFTPAVSVVGLYNPSGSMVLGQGHTDGMEVNGIIGHRFDWSAGWLASTNAAGITTPNAEDVYAHIGFKSGGVALDGEGKYGPNAPDPQKPWAEKAITVDGFFYHGLNALDNGTGATLSGLGASPIPQPTMQRDVFNAVGGSIGAQWDSAILSSGIQFEFHSHPYQGQPATFNPASGGTPAAVSPGVADGTAGQSLVQYNELDYVVFPWLVPGVRTEYSRLTIEPSQNGGSSAASLLRIIPGAAILVRPNIRVIVTGDIERAYGMPPAGSWNPNAAGFVAAPGPGQGSKVEAEQINITAALAY